jgi:putative ABC transport system substrate-binding protein
MRRREFITLLGACGAALPLMARAQEPGRVRRFGVLMGIGESDPEGQARVRALRQGLEQLNLKDGQNVQIDYRWGAGDINQIRTYAAELVALAPDVILATNTPTVRALQQLTRTISIVFLSVSDPSRGRFCHEPFEARRQHHGVQHLRAEHGREMGAVFEACCT